MSLLQMFQQQQNLYEDCVGKIIKHVPAHGGVFVDCGAHMGDHSVRMLARPDCKQAVCIEAIPSLCDLLFKKFGADSRFELVPLALGRKAGNTTFKIADNLPGYSGLRQRSVQEVTTWTTIDVHVETLDAILSDKLADVDIVKLDLEGGEFDALLGGQKMMTASRPFVVFENGLQKSAELYGYSVNDFFSYWQSLGYIVCDFFGETLNEEYWLRSLQTYMFVAYPRESLLDKWWQRNRTTILDDVASEHLPRFMGKRERDPSPLCRIGPENFQNFTFSRRSHWDLFKGSDQELFGESLQMDDCVLKKYQDLLVFLFLTDNLPPGSRILDVGGGYSRILKHFSETYDCWNIDKMEGMGRGTQQSQKIASLPYKLILDYMGNFNPALPDDSFDLVFSISALEHTPEDDPGFFDKIIQDINRVLKPGGYSLHLFDVRFLPDGKFWTNKLVHRIYETINTSNQFIPPERIKGDPDLYVMSEQLYNKNWLPITNLEYSKFGRPSSLNILWRKPL